MDCITGIVHNGRIIPDGRLAWPNGTKVDICPREEAAIKFGLDESEWRDDLAVFADWEAWIQAFEPMELSPAEEADNARFRKQMREFNIEAVRRQMGQALP